jgi:hypothetical protein
MPSVCCDCNADLRIVRIYIYGVLVHHTADENVLLSRTSMVPSEEAGPGTQKAMTLFAHAFPSR